MAILNNSNAISAGGYTVDNSLRFRASASAYLNRTPASAGNQQKFTWSGWVKRGNLGSEQAIIVCRTGSNAASGRIVFTSGDALQFFAKNSSSVTTALLNTTPVYRDPSAWYHIVLAVDTTQATAADRIKFYVNGNQVTTFSTATYPTQNTNLDFNTTADTYIGVEIPNSTYFDGYMAEVNFVNASQLTPSDFGETDTTTGVWKPKAYTGTYGTNGFYLKFSDIATTSSSNAGLGKDFSGNTNYWTTNNISVTSGTTYDAMIDSPTNASSGTRPVGNYCTLNPLSNLDATTLAAGNLNLTQTTGSSSVFGTIGVSSGKWYWEVICQSGVMVGVADTQRSGGTYPGGFANSCAWDTFYTLNSTNAHATGTFTKAGTISGSAGTAGQVIGTALDMDAGTIVYYINGSVQNSGNAVFTNITGTVYPVFRGSTTTSSVNFGQRPFAYTPPTGYQALCTTNLPTPTILQGNKYMDATLWTGNGSAQTITNAGGFKPDLVWAKLRSGAEYHVLNDSVRGFPKNLYTNVTNAEDTNSYITGVTSTGFTISNSSVLSLNNGTYVGWQWQAGQGSTSSNTSGSITSTVSVSTTAGFSVVTYTGNGTGGATVGHGLGVAPSMVIVKCRSNANDWAVYHSANTSDPKTDYLLLNSTAATADDNTYWNDTAPTSTLFSIGTNTDVNTNTYTYVAYCFAEIAGFSKFGSYTGNGSADGPFVFTGFRPKYVLTKSASGSYSWYVEDTSRSTYNVVGATLAPNTNSAEDTAWGANKRMDILSNGFKIRASTLETNENGATFIYAAFAENPFASNNRAR